MGGNLVTLFQKPISNPIMSGVERTVGDWLRAGDDVLYSATPHYRGSNPIPYKMIISAESSSGQTFLETVLNKM